MSIAELKTIGASIGAAMSTVRAGGSSEAVGRALTGLAGHLDDVLAPGVRAQVHIGPAVNFAHDAATAARSLAAELGAGSGANGINRAAALRVQGPTDALVAAIKAAKESVSGVTAGASKHLAWPV